METTMERFYEINASMIYTEQAIWDTIVSQQSKEINEFYYPYEHNQHMEVFQESDMAARGWQLLKKTTKALGGLSNHVGNLLQSIISITGSSKVKKTPNQIADKMIPASKLARDPAEIDKNKKNPCDKKKSAGLSATPIFIKEITEDDGLYIGLIGVNYTKEEDGKLKPISNSNGIRELENGAIIYKNMAYYIRHSEALENLANIVEKACKVMDEKSEINQKELCNAIRKTISKSHAFGVDFNAGGTKISMRDFTKFCARINQLTNAMDKFQNGNHSIQHLEKETVECMNKLVRELETVQHGLNGLSNEIGKVYMIKAQYVGTITDKSDLAKFVEECINAGVPPKFIAYNTWLIANEDIRGDKNDFNKVPMGQTRMVLFPKDKKIITKVAFSGRGLTSNKNEVRMSEFIQRSKEEEMIKSSAKIVGKYGKDCSVIDMERIIDHSGKHPTPAKLIEVKNQFKDFTSRHPELRLVVSDFNDGNVMWSSDRDCWVCIDYGIGRRDGTSEEKMNHHAEKVSKAYEEKTGKKLVNVTEKKDTKTE